MALKKSVLVTGCSEGGLGDALALEYHGRGFHVIATARNPEKMSHFAGLGIDTVVMDVESQESIDTCVKKVLQITDGSLDVLINNSGIVYMVPIIEADISKAKQIFDVNVLSYIAVLQAFLPLLKKAAPGSMIVNHSSVASVMDVPFGGLYSATKAAVAQLTNALRMELSPFGINVVELKTGAVDTPIFKNQKKAGSSKLPENSHYELARDVIEVFLDGNKIMQGAWMRDHWARLVVSDLTRSSPSPIIWRGANATFFWFTSTFLPHGATDYVTKKMSGIATLAERLKDEKKVL